MKNWLLFVTLLGFSPAIFAQDDEIDDTQDRIKVEKAVVRWADSVFYSHTNYKFENFRAEYSEGYFIAVMRAKAYKEQVTEFEQDKAAGRYKGTQEAYDAELKALKDKADKAQSEADNFKERADYYLIHFWSNIQTTDGITVYYEHIVKLNNGYQVIEATINSAIGKKDENTQILYKKDVNSGSDKKKVDSSPSEIKPVDGTTNGGTDGANSGNGSVSITPVTGTEATTTTGTKPKKEKKKKK